MATHQFREMTITVSDTDYEHKCYFEAAAQHRLVMKKCKACGLMRWHPGPSCPWCTCQEWEWQEVSGKGTVYSYEIVTQAILPGFRDWVPYPIALVELDEQRGVPTPDEGLRIMANLVDRHFQPEKEGNIAIGKRVEVIFMDVAPGFSVPQFCLSSEPPQEPVWQFRQR